MKKVSEVKKELEALGCNAKVAEDLLVACGILEREKGEIPQIGDVWAEKEDRREEYYYIVELTESKVIYHIFYLKNKPPFFNAQWRKETFPSNLNLIYRTVK